MANEYNDSEFIKLREKVHRLEIEVAVLEQARQDANEARTLAAEALKHSQAVSNEWRKENIDQRSTYPTISKVDGQLSTEAAKREALEARVFSLEKGSSAGTGRHLAFEDLWLKVTAVAALVIGALSLAYKLLTGK